MGKLSLSRVRHTHTAYYIKPYVASLLAADKEAWSHCDVTRRFANSTLPGDCLVSSILSFPYDVWVAPDLIL